MNIAVPGSWNQQLTQEFDKPYFKTLLHFVEKEYNTNTCYPKIDHIFAAFDHCGFDETKVVIIGQDPYHGPNQANGLCFSVQDDIAKPPSLVIIFKEIEADLGIAIPESGNLERWAKQGVLLLNATLSVRAHLPGSHQKKGWEQFTDATIKMLSDEKEGLIFLLWGGFAKKKIKLIDQKKHHIFSSGHPSPLSANRGYWFGHHHFSMVNDLLVSRGSSKIKW